VASQAKDTPNGANARGPQPVIQLQNVSYGYGGRSLLSGLNLDLPAGSFHFLTGPSGSGKTTILKLCYLDLRPDEGHITLFDQDAGSLNRDDIAALRRRVGVVHQNCEFLDHLTLQANIALPVTATGSGTASSENDLKELMVWVGLSDRADAMPPELSGGERQRGALARAVIVAPDVVLADEPTGNVDWEMSLRLLRLLIELNKMGKTILIATHDLNLIRAAKTQVAARVLRIRDGGVHAAGADL